MNAGEPLKAAASTLPVKPVHMKTEPAVQQHEEQPIVFDMSQTNTTGYIGGYSPESRRKRIEKFLQKRQNRIWMKRVKYDVRKNFADSRLRVKGRFVKKEDEELLREFIAMTL